MLIPCSSFIGNQSQNPTSYSTKPLYCTQTQVSDLIFDSDYKKSF